MDFFLQPLTLVTFFPLVGVLVLFFINSERKNALRWTALVTSLLTFGISLWVLSLFNASDPRPAACRQIRLDPGRRAGRSATPWALTASASCWCC